MEFVKPYLIHNKKKIPFTSLRWSGTDTQASRQIEFEIPWNPFDSSFPQIKIKKGDIIEMWFDGSDHAWFIGTITSREKTDEIGTASFTAKDFMHYLLQSTGTYIFKNTTPEAIAKKVCGDISIPTDRLFKTGINIKKMIFENACLYDIIIKAYRKVKSETKKNYMPLMLGNKVGVIEKGNPCGAVLKQGVNITRATYSDNIDNMVNLVRIYNQKHKEVNAVKNEKDIQKYGIYQQTIQKEADTSAKKEAEAMLYGSTREASVEALGDIRAMSGFSIIIKDDATGLEGKFYITSDEHTFSQNTHTMSLNLSWKDTMEEGANIWKKEKSTETGGTIGGGGTTLGGGSSFNMPSYNNAMLIKDAKEKANNQYCFFIDVVSGYGYMGQPVYAQTLYHSSSGCKELAKEKKKYNTNTTYSKKVGEVKKMRRIIQAPQTQGQAYKPCSCCWKSGRYGEMVAKETAQTQGSYASNNQGYTKSNTSAIDAKSDPRYAHGYIYNHLDPLKW